MHVVYNMQEQMDNISNTNTRKPIPKYMIFKLQKTKDQEKILKEATDPGLGQGEPHLQKNKNKNDSGPLTGNHTRGNI